ncbi:MAG: DsbA family oxidoreductase [Aestuariivirga sp.]
MAQSVISIDVVADVICPWCFLGKRRLDKALAQVPEIKVEVSNRPFFLDPTIPPEGLDRHKYMAEKFGEARLATIHRPLEEMGAKDGVPYQFDKIKRTPNTLDAHRLIRWAQQAGRQPAVVEALFMAYWNEGRDVGDHDTLAAIATECGMDGREVAQLLKQDTDKQAVLTEAQRAVEMGVTGVPTFILQQRFGISGAQDVDVLVDAIKKVAAQATA